MVTIPNNMSNQQYTSSVHPASQVNWHTMWLQQKAGMIVFSMCPSKWDAQTIRTFTPWSKGRSSITTQHDTWPNTSPSPLMCMISKHTSPSGNKPYTKISSYVYVISPQLLFLSSYPSLIGLPPPSLRTSTAAPSLPPGRLSPTCCVMFLIKLTCWILWPTRPSLCSGLRWAPDRWVSDTTKPSRSLSLPSRVFAPTICRPFRHRNSMLSCVLCFYYDFFLLALVFFMPHTLLPLFHRTNTL